MGAVEVSNGTMIREEISTAKELSGKVNVSIVLEEAIIFKRERVIYPRENDFLVLDMVNVLALDDLMLLHCFDSIFLGWIAPKPANSDQTECTYIYLVTNANDAYLLRASHQRQHHWDSCHQISSIGQQQPVPFLT